MNEYLLEYWKAMCYARAEAQRAAIRAQMEEYAAQMEEYAAQMEECAAKIEKYAAKAESFGYTKDHPFMVELARQAAEARSLDIPVPPIPPALEVPSFEFTAPEIPRFEFPQPPEPPAK